MGKVQKIEPISAICKDCGRDFIITVEEQKRFKLLGFELPKRCCECRKKRREEKRVAEAKIDEDQIYEFKNIDRMFLYKNFRFHKFRLRIWCLKIHRSLL